LTNPGFFIIWYLKADGGEYAHSIHH